MKEVSIDEQSIHYSTGILIIVLFPIMFIFNESPFSLGAYIFGAVGYLYQDYKYFGGK